MELNNNIRYIHITFAIIIKFTNQEDLVFCVNKIKSFTWGKCYNALKRLKTNIIYFLPASYMAPNYAYSVS